jgi:ficolin
MVKVFVIIGLIAAVAAAADTAIKFEDADGSACIIRKDGEKLSFINDGNPSSNVHCDIGVNGANGGHRVGAALDALYDRVGSLEQAGTSVTSGWLGPDADKTPISNCGGSKVYVRRAGWSSAYLGYSGSEVPLNIFRDKCEQDPEAFAMYQGDASSGYGCWCYSKDVTTALYDDATWKYANDPPSIADIVDNGSTGAIYYKPGAISCFTSPLYTEAPVAVAAVADRVLTLENQVADHLARVEALEALHLAPAGPFSSCSDAMAKGASTSGVKALVVSGVAMNVYCDQTTDGGGWEVFQKRSSASQSFFQDWNAYKNGFGDTQNWWLGNDNLAILTGAGNAAGNSKLRIDLNYEGEHRHALYSEFRVAGASQKYTLTAAGYSGNAGDSLSYHSGHDFGTKDQENNDHGCANAYQGAWWYGSCHHSNLNGIYHAGAHASYADGVNWSHWKGYHESMTVSEMKTRIGGHPTTLACTGGSTVYASCTHAYQSGNVVSGFYCVDPQGLGRFSVFCDQTTDGGGWEVFQRRADGSVDFYENMASNRAGFGNEVEFWLGLDDMVSLSTANEMRVDLWSGSEFRTAYYSGFTLSAAPHFVLGVGAYSGDAGDSLTYHSGHDFGTHDDEKNDHSCASAYNGAWWYGSCHHANLNGIYYNGDHTSYADGVNWSHWKGYHHSLSRTEMKVRVGGHP